MEREKAERKLESNLPNLLSSLLAVSPVASAIKEGEARYQLRPRAAEGILDVAFFPRNRSLERRATPLPLFGLSHCVGLKIVLPEELKRNPEIIGEINNNPYIQDIKEQSNISDEDVVAVMAEDDLASWLHFYEQVQKEKLDKKVSPNLLSSLSGLERTSPAYYSLLKRNLEAVLREHQKYLQSENIEVRNSQDGLDLIFVNPETRQVGLNFYHLREVELKGSVFSKKVNPNANLVVGAVIKRVGENERETWQKALEIEKKIASETGCSGRVVVVSGGQLSLFEKWGFDRPLTPVFSNCQVSLWKIMEYLYLGQGNDDPGFLARREFGLSLPRNSSSYGIDVLFEKRGKSGKREVISLDQVIGLNLDSREDKLDFTRYDNIGGLVCIPDNFDKKKIKNYLEEKEAAFNRINIGSNIDLLPVNSTLLEKWQEEGITTLSGVGSTETERSSFFFPKIARGEGDLRLKIFSLGPAIGSARFIIQEREGSQITNWPIDFGTLFSGLPIATRSLLGGGMVSGLRPKFKNGELPLVPGIYYKPYLWATAKACPVISDARQKDPWISFLRAELVRRFDYDELIDLLGRDTTVKIQKLGQAEAKTWWNEVDEIKVGKIIFSHAHQDHSGMGPFLDGDLLVTWQTAALLQASSNHASNWSQDSMRLTRIDLPKKNNRYLRELREVEQIFKNGQEFSLSPNLSVKFFFTDHSALGSAALGFHSKNGNILYSGDIKTGPLTDEALNLISRENYQTILWECTNLPGLEKPSVKFKEKDVLESIENVLLNHQGELIIIATPQNNLTRLETIMQAVSESRSYRQIVVGLKHADVLNHLRRAAGAASPEAVGRDFFLPEPGRDVGIYVKPSLVLRKWQREIINSVSDKNFVIDEKTLAKNKGNFVLVLTPFDYPEYSIGGSGLLKKTVYIFSAPYPHDSESKARLARIKSEVNRDSGLFLADVNIGGNVGRVFILKGRTLGYHASGHATFEENMNLLEIILQSNDKPKRVFFTHGERPEFYAQKAEGWFTRKGTTRHSFYGRFKHYQPQSPFFFPGQTIDFKF